MDNLVPWNKIEHQIDEARDLKTITQMQAQVEAIKIIVKQRGGSLKAQNKCSRYRICLEQKAGNIYKQAPDETGKRTDLTSGSDSPKLTNRKQIIKDTGKDKKTFHKWAKESEIKEKESVRLGKSVPESLKEKEKSNG